MKLNKIEIDKTRKKYEDIKDMLYNIGIKYKDKLDVDVANHLNALYGKTDKFIEFYKDKEEINFVGETKESYEILKEESAVITSAETRKKLNKFFETISDSVAKREEWKNLYQFCLENTAPESSRQIKAWKDEKRIVKENFKQELKKYPNLDIRTADQSVEDSKNNLKAMEEAVNLLEDKKEFDAIRKAYKDKYPMKMSSPENYFDDPKSFDDMIQNCFKLISTAMYLKDDIKKRIKDINYQTDVLKVKHAQKLALESKRSAYKDSVKNVDTKYDKAYAKAEKISELRGFVKIAREYDYMVRTHTKVRDYVSKYERNYEIITTPLSQLDEKIRKGFLDSFEDELESKLHIKKEELNQLSMQDIIDRGSNELYDFGSEYNDAERAVSGSKSYQEIFHSKEIQDALDKMEKKENEKPSNEEYLQVLDDLEESKSRRAYYMNGMKSRIETLKSNVNVINQNSVLSALEENKNVDRMKTAEEMIQELDRYIEKVEQRQVKLEIQQKELSKLKVSEAKLNRNEDYKQYKEAKEKHNALVKDKENLDREKEKVTSLKERINPQAVKESVVEKAENLYELKDVRRGGHKDSKEYAKMISALEVVKNWNSPDEKGKDAPATLNAALKNLKDASDAYLTAKKSQLRIMPSALRQSRLALAESISEFAKSGMEDMKLIPEANKEIDAQMKKDDAQSKNLDPMEDELDIIGI